MAEATKPLNEKERLEKLNERYVRALELSEEKDELPKIATEEYHGPSEAMTALVRGSILGVVGYFAGRTAGRLLHPNPKPGKGQALVTKLIAGTGATVLGIMGLQSGSKQVRDSRSQMRRMQNTITKIFMKNEALKEELKEQLKGAGKLDAAALQALEEAEELEQIAQGAEEQTQIPQDEERQVVDDAQARADTDELEVADADIVDAVTDVDEPEIEDEEQIDREADEAVEVADLDDSDRFGHDEEGRRSGKKAPGDIIAQTTEAQTELHSDAELEETPDTAVSMQGIQHETIGPQQPQLGA